MDFDAMLEQVLELIQRQRRVSYRALKRRFNMDDAYLEDLKEEILFAYPSIVDEAGRGLIWTGEAGTTPEPLPPASQPVQQPVQTETPLVPHPTSEAERRQLTVMFCDLMDSTKLSALLDPEEYRDVVRAYQATCTAVIRHFDGHIAQYLGDGLLVYFGYPHAHEDDAQRAVHAGLGSIAAMTSLNARLVPDKGLQLAVRIGIHTGPVVVGEIGVGSSQEHLAMGETPNIAARIQGLAEPDTVVISAATWQLVQGYFACQTLGQHTLRGTLEPMAVSRVLRESGTQSRLEIALTLTPLVGRAQDVALLLDRWGLAKAGQGQVVILNGEPGIGKSRLVQVLKDQVADEPYTRVECRSSPYYQQSALHPIIDWLHRVLGWQPEEPPTSKLAKLEHTLEQYRLPVAETLPLFATLLSLPLPADRDSPLMLTPQQQRQKTLETLIALVLELSERQPVLFILEGLHWTDPTTLEFLSLLIDQAPTASLYIVLTCRPSFQPSWSSRSYLTQLTLNRLTRRDVEGMVEQVVEGKRLPAEVLHQIVEKTDGVPLFVEEMTKALLESGHLKEVDGHYELIGPLPSMEIPSTLQDSLMARLDRLISAKGIAQLGATIGRRFSYALLQAVSQLDEATLQRELGRLVEAELLYQRGLPLQATYVFKHALIQDAAYQSLLKSTRQQYHHKIAQILEEQFADTAATQPELLAYHYTEAGLNEQAIRYWHKAGQRSVERSANVEAIAHLTKGLELLKTLPDTSERALQELTLQRHLGVALIVTKGFAAPEVEHAYARARELCQHVGDTQQVFPVLFGLWGYYHTAMDLPTARGLAEQLLILAQRQHDSALILQGNRALGDTLHRLGEFVAARTYLEQGIELYDRQQHHSHALRYGQDPGMGCLGFAAIVLWMLGYPEQALQRSHQALTVAQDVSHPFSLTFALSLAGRLHTLRREWRVAQEQAETMIALSTEQGNAFHLAAGTTMRACALIMQHPTEEEIAQIRQSFAARRTTGMRTVLPWLALLAEAYGKVGQAEEGLTVLFEAQTYIDHTGDRFCVSELSRLTGELLLKHAIPDPGQAATCFQRALDIARHQEAKSLELRAAMSLSRLWQRQGKQKQAYELLAEVYGWFTEGFDTADLQEAQSLLEALSS